MEGRGWRVFLVCLNGKVRGALALGPLSASGWCADSGLTGTPTTTTSHITQNRHPHLSPPTRLRPHPSHPTLPHPPQLADIYDYATPCFPPDYRIFGVICAEYHQQLSSMLDFIGLCADNLANGDILKVGRCLPAWPACLRCCVGRRVGEYMLHAPGPWGGLSCYCQWRLIKWQSLVSYLSPLLCVIGTHHICRLAPLGHTPVLMPFVWLCMRACAIK